MSQQSWLTQDAAVIKAASLPEREGEAKKQKQQRLLDSGNASK
jgi:hypothetical protein